MFVYLIQKIKGEAEEKKNRGITVEFLFERNSSLLSAGKEKKEYNVIK